MSENVKLAKAFVTSKYAKEIIETGKFKLDALSSQLSDNKLEFLALGGIIIPKNSIVKIELEYIKE